MPHFGKMFGLCSVSNGKLSKGLKQNSVIIRSVFSRKIALAAVWRESCDSTKDAGRSGRERLPSNKDHASGSSRQFFPILLSHNGMALSRETQFASSDFQSAWPPR